MKKGVFHKGTFKHVMNQRKAGVILTYISMGLNSIIMLLYVPMLLHYLTKEVYGIYQLMGSIIAYLSIMDFGLANTTTRYLAQAYSQKDTVRVGKIISTSHSLYLGIAILLVLIGSFFYGFITPLYGHTLSVENLALAKQIYLIMLFNIAITIPSNIFIATINAQESFIFLRGLNLIKVIIQPLIIWGILSWQASVLNLVLVQTAFNLLMIFLNYLYCKIKLQLSFPTNFSDKLILGELTGFSIFIFLHTVMDQIYTRLGQLVLGAVDGASSVASYAIAIQLVGFSITLPAAIGSVFLPKISALAIQNKDMKEINAIFCKIGRLQFMAIMLLLVGFAFLGKTFIYLWVGKGYEICYWVALLLMAAYVLDVSQNIGIPILQALKKHAFRAYVYIAMAALNTVLCILLAKRYGEIGCALATTVCLLLGSGVAINWYYAHIGLDVKLFFRNLGYIFMGIIPAIILVWGLFWKFPLQPSWISLVWHGVSLTGIYCVSAWLLAFNDYEKNLIITPLTKFLIRPK